jgi:L-threonylcarbamoyladenylate synthase
VPTLRIEIDPASCRPADLAEAVSFLRAGGIVAFPTDTLYGLAVDPASPVAVDRLFALKERPASAAVPFVAASVEQVEAWTTLSADAARLAAAFWPGPLSLICSAPGTIVPAIHAALGTVAVRVPAHRVARALAAAWGSPLPATSANISGRPPAVRVEELAMLASAHLMVIDGGPAAGGAPSTIVDARQMPPVLVREGAIAWDRVLDSLQR